MSEHVIAFDPGHRTGWASAHMEPDRLILSGSGVLSHLQMNMAFATSQRVGSLLHPKMPGPRREFDKVVLEAWVPREKNGSMEWIKGNPLWEVQHIGALKEIARQSGVEVVEQKPSDKGGGRASYPAKLRAIDAESSELHDQDARLHLWIYFFENWFTTKVDPDDCVVM